MKRLTKVQIIEETAEFYSKNPQLRGTSDGFNCMFNGPDGRHCAVGRCLSTKYKNQALDLLGNSQTVSGLIDSNKVSSINDMLIAKYKGHDNEFWIELQVFHDTNSNWSSDGITPKGIHLKEILIKKYM